MKVCRGEAGSRMGSRGTRYRSRTNRIIVVRFRWGRHSLRLSSIHGAAPIRCGEPYDRVTGKARNLTHQVRFSTVGFRLSTGSCASGGTAIRMTACDGCVFDRRTFVCQPGVSSGAMSSGPQLRDSGPAAIDRYRLGIRLGKATSYRGWRATIGCSAEHVTLNDDSMG